jgi:hypothetical protein
VKDIPWLRKRVSNILSCISQDYKQLGLLTNTRTLSLTALGIRDFYLRTSWELMMKPSTPTDYKIIFDHLDNVIHMKYRELLRKKGIIPRRIEP